jgi:hypothetical protein
MMHVQNKTKLEVQIPIYLCVLESRFLPAAGGCDSTEYSTSIAASSVDAGSEKPRHGCIAGLAQIMQWTSHLGCFPAQLAWNRFAEHSVHFSVSPLGGVRRHRARINSKAKFPHAV